MAADADSVEGLIEVCELCGSEITGETQDCPVLDDGGPATTNVVECPIEDCSHEWDAAESHAIPTSGVPAVRRSGSSSTHSK